MAHAHRAREAWLDARAGARGDVARHRVGDSRGGNARRAERDQGARLHTRVRVRRARALQRPRHVRESTRRAHARRGAAARDRLRERGQPAAGARRRAPARDVAAHRDRRQPRADRATTAHRESAARSLQRRGGAARRVVGKPRAGGDGVGGQSHLSVARPDATHAGVHVRLIYSIGAVLRAGAGSAGVARRSGGDAAFERALGDARRAVRHAADRSAGGAVARAARRRDYPHGESAADRVDPAWIRPRSSDRRRTRRRNSWLRRRAPRQRGARAPRPHRGDSRRERRVVFGERNLQRYRMAHRHSRRRSRGEHTERHSHRG